MIKIKSLDVQLSGLKILEVDGYYDLTTADSDNYNMSPSDGGLQISPDFELIDVAYGKIYVLQVI